MTAERKLFGTDGIRGKANTYPMTGEVAMALGRALTHIIRAKRGKKTPRIVIGKDTRLSGYMLETAISSGICSMGGEVLLVGPMPTPGISFITHSMRADAGVVISASHNPFDDNGIKLFWSDGYKLPDQVELELEKLILSPEILFKSIPTASKVGRAARIDDATGRYIVELKHTFPRNLTLEGIHVVVDCANGAGYRVAPSVFEELGAKVNTIGCNPNGLNINESCGALYPNKGAIKVLETGAHVGITLDGDADRLILVDDRGQVVDGDAVMALCACEMIKEGSLKKNTVVTTVMSNLGLDRALEQMGGRLVRTAVGDRYVVEEMRTNGYNFGGEQSGHLIFSDHSTTGDGILAALQILAIMVKQEKELSELAHGIMERVPQALSSFNVPEKISLEELPQVGTLIGDIESSLGKDGRVFVRYSGTEAKIRVLVEGPEQKSINKYAQDIKDSILEAFSSL
jgi:phosphoglucosamine mutase